MTGFVSNAPETKISLLRDRDVVMDLERLGSFFPHRLSFMRTLIRRMNSQKWKISTVQFDLDDDGLGIAVYQIETFHQKFHFVVFANYLDPAMQNDRVTSEQWDVTTVLCAGPVDPARLARFKENVPRQENGRVDCNSIVISRANKSLRNFDYVVECLSAGHQPETAQLAKVGYLYRTTAVYGSGKFGLADWRKVSTTFSDFAYPFAAEMLTCFMIRHFSIQQVHFLAKRKAPDTAIELCEPLQRYMGIGNATGLGMAPFLISHPLLISRWIEVREKALAAALSQAPSVPKQHELLTRLQRAVLHLREFESDNDVQNEKNHQSGDELEKLIAFINTSSEVGSWELVTEFARTNAQKPAQEILNVLLIELYPSIVDPLEVDMLGVENYSLEPSMSLIDLETLIKTNYKWALACDFNLADEKDVFWYRSEEKMEPRLGTRNVDPGQGKEINIGIAHNVSKCLTTLKDYLPNNSKATVAEFVARFPEHRAIVRRIQTMSKTMFGDIQENLLHRSVLPTHLLRCKLSFFGVSKFDPKSRLWVRNVMFQGAPIASDIGGVINDDWNFAIIPEMIDE